MKKSFIVAIMAMTLVLVCVLSGCSGQTFDPAKGINVITREAGSGTRGAFIELTGIEQKDAAGNKIDRTTVKAAIAVSTQAVLTGVEQDLYAVGYISLGSLNDKVKAVKVNGVEATAANVKSESYKISRPFNIAYKQLSAVGTDFVNFIMSSAGQQIVSENNYIAVEQGAVFTSQKPAGNLSVSGSSSVHPLMEKLIEAYKKLNGNANITLQQSDSSTGMTDAMEGSSDIGMASRELKDSEKAVLTYKSIALDGIAVIVNKKNTTVDLTVEQICSIYIGDKTDWQLQ